MYLIFYDLIIWYQDIYIEFQILNSDKKLVDIYWWLVVICYGKQLVEENKQEYRLFNRYRHYIVVNSNVTYNVKYKNTQSRS